MQELLQQTLGAHNNAPPLEEKPLRLSLKDQWSINRDVSFSDPPLLVNIQDENWWLRYIILHNTIQTLSDSSSFNFSLVPDYNMVT